MDAVTLIEQAQGLGLALSVADGRLNITGPKTKAVAELVQRMAACKAELIAALAPEPAPTEAQTALTFADYEAMIGQVVTAQRLYDLQRETAAQGWTIHGVRHGAVVDGYCNEWLVTKVIP